MDRDDLKRIVGSKENARDLSDKVFEIMAKHSPGEVIVTAYNMIHAVFISCELNKDDVVGFVSNQTIEAANFLGDCLSKKAENNTKKEQQ